MKIYFYAFVLLALPLILISGCKKDEPVDGLIDPADANALSRVLILPDGNAWEDGTPPSSTQTSTTPAVQNFVTNLTSSNGSTTPLSFGYANTNNDLAGCYVQIDGAGNYFTVPYTQTAGNSGQLSLPLGIPTNVDEGEFDVNFCVYNSDGEVSNVVSTTVNVLRLGTGSIQISLSWDNDSDQDLYVTDPNGETIYYSNDISATGGELDRDDVDGYGPENIFWVDGAPDGEYRVEVDPFSGPSPTTFYVTVNGFGSSRSFNGVTDNEAVSVVTFQKTGERLEF